MVIEVWPQERTQERHRKTKLIILTGPGERVAAHLKGAVCEKHQGTALAQWVEAKREPVPMHKSLYGGRGGFGVREERLRGIALGHLNLPKPLVSRVQRGDARQGPALSHWGTLVTGAARS